MYTSLRPDTLRAYVTDVFVETGTNEGHASLMALNVGFTQVRTVELSDHYYEIARKNFASKGSAILQFKGKSQDVLWDMIKDVEGRMTFWLDGHFSFGDTARSEINCPLMQELDAISRHPRKDHIILIDDVREFGTDTFDGLEKNTVIERIKSINKDYIIGYADSSNIPADILVAEL